jgi:hypothetical protein
MKRITTAAAALLLSSCAGTGLTFDPAAGICATSADGRYAVCYNPASNGYTLKAPGLAVRALTWDKTTRTWRADLPDGTSIIYTPGRPVTIEPPLPVGHK